jgi:hypothetical protein
VSTARWDLKGARRKSRPKLAANQRWPPTPTTRRKNREVSYGTFGPFCLRGSVQKADGGVGTVIMITSPGYMRKAIKIPLDKRLV